MMKTGSLTDPGIQDVSPVISDANRLAWAAPLR